MRNTRESDAAGSLYPRHATSPVTIAAAAALLCGLLQTPPARAIEFEDGELQGSLSTTISHGVTVRVEDRDPKLAADTNGNDGDLNYDRGIVSNTSKFTSDLDVRSGNVGAFVRATGFIDHENENGTRERTPLSDAAKDLVGKDLEVLDAYVTGTFDVSDAIVDARLGRHVLNWGESTFIPNGINAVNHFDVSKPEAAGLGVARSAAAGRAGVARRVADQRPDGGGLLPARMGGDADRPGRQLLLEHRLRGTGREPEAVITNIPGNLVIQGIRLWPSNPGDQCRPRTSHRCTAFQAAFGPSTSCQRVARPGPRSQTTPDSGDWRCATSRRI